MNGLKSDFEFRGTAGEYLGVGILAWLLTVCTLGIGFPWAYVMVLRYDSDNILVTGRRIRFNGTGLGLIGNWIKWVIFTFCTLGFYSFWIYPNLQKWRWANTDFE